MKITMISQNFGREAAALGEGLLYACMSLSKNNTVHVLTLSSGVHFSNEYSSKIFVHRLASFTSSSSRMLFRIIEIVYFGLWVFFNLLRHKPDIVYVTSSPPVYVPFFVSLYAKVFKKKYIYHLQDIHPEAANLTFKIPPFIFVLLQKLDSFSLSNANINITLNLDMEQSLLDRAGSNVKVKILENPGFILQDIKAFEERRDGIVYTGNVGRFQLMPLVLKSLDLYLKKGGSLQFCFVGGGLYSNEVECLSAKWPQVKWKGKLDGLKAAEISSDYKWALLPIDPRVLKFAFPSKLASYLGSGCKIISVTDSHTGLAKLVRKASLGLNSEPTCADLVKTFFLLESRRMAESKVVKLVKSPIRFGEDLATIIESVA